MGVVLCYIYTASTGWCLRLLVFSHFVMVGCRTAVSFAIKPIVDCSLPGERSALVIYSFLCVPSSVLFKAKGSWHRKQ